MGFNGKYRRIVTPLCSLFACLFSAHDVTEPNADYYRYLFAFPLTGVIHQADHFGIKNDMMSAGIDPNAAVDVQGLFAPPFVSSDFRFTVNVDGAPLKPTSGSWLPIRVTAKHALNPVQMDSSMNLPYGQRAMLVSVLVSPRDGRKTVHLSGECMGTLDVNTVWEFARPASQSKTSPSFEGDTLLLTQGENAIALMWGTNPDMPPLDMHWDVNAGRWSCEVPVNQQNYFGQIRFSIVIGKRESVLAAAKEALRGTDFVVEDSLADRTKKLLE